ncbi:MAG: hypothetical protein KF773_41520 [Deltaproteobacteria bacterium]|nr:hypothetical protein [Deltaproteobacteria bacterium]
MNISGRELIDALEKVAPLEWYRFPSLEAGDLTKAPLVVWRFDPSVPAERVGHLISVLRSIVDRHEDTQWILQFSGRNWALKPSRLQELFDSGRFQVDVEARIHLQENDPDYCRLANSSLAKIASDLEAALQGKPS